MPKGACSSSRMSKKSELCNSPESARTILSSHMAGSETEAVNSGVAPGELVHCDEGEKGRRTSRYLAFSATG